MAKDLPYFKFFCSEWNDGDITLETYEYQGLFINICSYYWSNECNVNFDKLLKRFRGHNEIIDDLNASGLFKINQDRTISITFLDEQRNERLEQKKIKRKGGLASAKARKLKKIQHKSNTTLTENEHVLKSCSTETQLLRREEKRRDKIKKEIIYPSKKEFMIYARSKFATEEEYKKHRQSLIWKFEAWETADWIDGNGKKIKNWKSKILHNLKFL